jgi:hypothetical protein
MADGSRKFDLGNQINVPSYLSEELDYNGRLVRPVAPASPDHSLDVSLVQAVHLSRHPCSASAESVYFRASEASVQIAGPMASQLYQVEPNSLAPRSRTAENTFGSSAANEDFQSLARFADPSLSLRVPNDEKEFHAGPQQYRAYLPHRRRISRKKGRACLLCGFEKVKVS